MQAFVLAILGLIAMSFRLSDNFLNDFLTILIEILKFIASLLFMY